MDRGAWQATVHGVMVPGRRRGKRGFPTAPRERPRESFFNASRAWRIPWTEKPSKLQSMGSYRVGTPIFVLVDMRG